MFATRRLFSPSAALQQALLRHQQKVTHVPAAAAAVSCRFKSTDHHSSSTALIINAVGQDRLGIVSDITGMVIENGGNVSESQAAKLGSYFSLMMMVHVPTTNGNNLDTLKKQLSSMSDMNVSIFETLPSNQTSVNKRTPQVAYSGKFTLEGADHPGIVHKLTTALAQHGLSIDKMETDQEIAPHGGTVLFRMRGIAQAAAPLCKSFDAARIGQELRQLGDDLNCTVDLIDITNDSYEASFVAG